MTTPKVFISYSWSNPAHEQWVIRLATELVESGVDVLLDKWALKEGGDAHAYMEQMVTNPEITKVIVICDRIYAEKADGRSGGVGTETQIITPEIYGKQSQTKFVAVISEKDENGNGYVPTFYKSRIYIEMGESAVYGDGFEPLLRWIFEKPLYVKPPLGKTPAFLLSGDEPKIFTTARFRRAQELLRNGQPYAIAAAAEFFDVVSEGLEQFRLKGADFTQDTYDEAVVKSITDFVPYRDECIGIFQLLARYASEDDASETVQRFIEKTIPYTERPTEIMQYQKWDYDNYRFLTHELYLCVIATLLKEGKFRAAAKLLDAPFYITSKETTGGGAMHSYRLFMKELPSFVRRNTRLNLRRHSLQADFLQERATNPHISFRDLVQADFVIYLHSRLSGDFWYPITGVFESFILEPFEIFARARSSAYFERLKPLLGDRTIAVLKVDIARLEADPKHLPRYNFHLIVPSKCIGLEELSTRP
jgi:hypothetical protein